MVEMVQPSKPKKIPDLFENKEVISDEIHRRNGSFVRLFYVFCFVILLIIAFDLSKIWGLWGFLPSAIIFIGLLYRFIPIAIMGVPLTFAYPWMMWLHGESPASIFWIILVLYSVYFIYRNILSKRK
ncbi:MAG: hypothetical protein ACE5NG_20950 [bacterium]